VTKVRRRPALGDLGFVSMVNELARADGFRHVGCDALRKDLAHRALFVGQPGFRYPRPASAPVVNAGSDPLPKLFTSTPNACAIETRRWLLAPLANFTSWAMQESLGGAQSGVILSRRPNRNGTFFPPASTVGTDADECRLGFPI